jgi:hypothetical protein
VPFIHWAGVPRPSESLFARAPLFFFYSKLQFVKYTYVQQKQVPALDIWEHFSKGLIKRPFLKTVKDVRWVFLPVLKKLIFEG